MVDVHVGEKTVLNLFMGFSVRNVYAAVLYFHHFVWLCLWCSGGVPFYCTSF